MYEGNEGSCWEQQIKSVTAIQGNPRTEIIGVQLLTTYDDFIQVYVNPVQFNENRGRLRYLGWYCP